MLEDVSNLNNLSNLKMIDGILPAISTSNDFFSSSINVDELITDLKLELGGVDLSL